MFDCADRCKIVSFCVVNDPFINSGSSKNISKFFLKIDKKLLDLKKLDVITDFNLLLFFNDFTEDYWINTITNNFDVFTRSKIW